MGEAPAMKGIAMQAAWERYSDLLRRGVLTREAALRELPPEALPLLDGPPQPSLWYPVAIGEQLTESVVQFDGRGRADYAKELGHAGFRTVLTRDALRSFVEGAMRRGERAGPTLIGLASLVYNFGAWHFEGDNLRDFQVRVRDAQAFGRLLVWASAGFMESLVDATTGQPVVIDPDWPEPSVVVFRARPA